MEAVVAAAVVAADAVAAAVVAVSVVAAALVAGPNVAAADDAVAPGKAALLLGTERLGTALVTALGSHTLARVGRPASNSAGTRASAA